MKAKSPDSEWVRSQRKANVSGSDRRQQTWLGKQDAFVPLWSSECSAMLDKQEPFYSNQPKCCSPWQIFQRRPTSLAGSLLWRLVLKITAFFFSFSLLPDCLWEMEARFQQQAQTDKRSERFFSQICCQFWAESRSVTSTHTHLTFAGPEEANRGVCFIYQQHPSLMQTSAYSDGK